jgi:hypothetical protein
MDRKTTDQRTIATRKKMAEGVPMRRMGGAWNVHEGTSNLFLIRSFVYNANLYEE